MSDTLEVVDGAPADLVQEHRILTANYELLQENMADVILALDNVGWNVVGENLMDATEVPLDTIRKKAQTTRALLSLNPIIKRGVAVRTAYIWGSGVDFIGLDTTSKFCLSPVNQKFFLSPQALGELEAVLATDGNLCLLVSKGGIRKANPDKARITRLPLAQITGTVSDPDNAEDIWFYRREWNTTDNSKTEETATVTANVAYYPSVDYEEANGRPARIRGQQVIWHSAIAHHSVNKQVGWRWGLADLTSVIFWAGAHKRYLEMSAKLVEAYSRFAFKATLPSKAGVTNAAMKIGKQPGRDPMTGQPNEVGGTAVMSQGANLQAIGRTGGSVDFKGGNPLAGYVAAGLEIPLTELLSDAGDANRSSAETLNNATNKAMQARQEAHRVYFEKIFAYLGMTVTLKFPPIETEPVYRMIQALAASLPLNSVFPEEMRKLVRDAFGLDGKDKPPTEEELGLLLASNTQAAKDAAQATKDAATAAAANPVARNNAASYGDNSARTQDGAKKTPAKAQ